MRNLKKFLALVLAMMMAMSLMVTANAATANVEYTDDYQVNEAFEEAVTVLSGMSVIKGYNGGETFGPKQNITRAEAATLVYRLATGDVSGEKEYLYTDYALQNSLTDVTKDKWYAGAVGYCANFGIVKGRPDGLFHANDPVTGYEILAMILRVVGYDKNGEFSGADWAYNVSTLANSLGVTNQVKTANYSEGGTSNLYAAATREVVASLLFETVANVPKVVYSPALGYSQYGIVGGVLGSVKNDTVGHDIFGLRSNFGIVVGNEDTGETKSTTKIGFDLINSGASLNQIDNSLSHSRVQDFNNKVQSAYVYDTDTVNSNPKNVTLTFKWDSDLGLFGHKVKVWYSDFSGAVETAGAGRNFKFPTNLNTYAVFDKTPADNVKVIHGAADLTDLAVTSTGAVQLGKKVSNFDTTNGVYWNYAFGPTKANDHAVSPEDAPSANWTSDSDFASPIKAYNNKNVIDTDNDRTPDVPQYPLYLVISNHPDGKADIVISLDMTISQITQVNSVFNKVPTVGVFNANSEDDITDNGYVRTDDFGYFDRIDDHQAASQVTDTSTVYTEIAQANLVGKSTKTLGDKVVAIAITGTTGANNGDNANDTAGVAKADLKGNASQPANSTLESNYYYKLSKLQNVVSATVYTVDTSNGKVTLSDGSVMERSPYANVVDASFAMAANVVADTARYPLSNVTYSFTLDREGRYIYFETTNDPGNFVYATYLDYVTELNSSTYKYSITAVNGNGERRQVYDVTKWDNVDFSKFDTPLVADGYNSNGLPKRDSSSWGTVVPGRYIGYILSGTTLREVTAKDKIDGQTMNVGSGIFDQYIKDDYVTLDSNNACKTTITATDAVIGAKQVAASDLFLTEETVFHIVSGAGTDTQDVKTYKGLSELTKDMRSVVINGGYAKDTAVIEKDWTVSGSSYNLRYADMTYFTASPFRYAQNYGFTYGSAKAAKVVYLPADAVTFNGATTSSLYFVGDNSSTTINAYGENAVQFTMFQDGVEGKYWVEGKLSDDTAKTSTNYGGGTSSSAGIILNEGKNVFYGLADSGKKTNFGETIYKVVEAADPNSGNTQKNVDRVLIGQYWNGTAVDISSNANLTAVGQEAYYNATTNALQAAFIDHNKYISGNATELYNVTNAKVASANSAYAIKTLADLHAAGSLYDDMGVPVSCVLSADSNRVVSCIYVNA